MAHHNRVSNPRPGPTPRAGRGTRRYRQLRANLRLQRRPCCICHQPIDYTLDYPDPDSFSVEHVHDWATHPHLREDPTNLDAAHLRCNTTQGRHRPRPGIGATSRDW